MTSKEYNLAVDEYADNIYRFVLKQIGNEMDARDVVQETFTKVWVRREKVEYSKVKSYLFTSAYNTMLDFIKKEKRSGDIEQSKESSAYSSNHVDLQEILHKALDRLPEIQKTVVLLRDYEGYNYDEIAEITGLSSSQVKVYIFRARKNLKEYIKRLDLVI